MTNEKDSDHPTADPDSQTPPPPPVSPPAPLQGALPDDGKRKADDTKNEADELAREFRVAEKWVIGTNITLIIVGIIALCIYHGQLNQMIESNKISRDSLQSVQRAFVNYLRTDMKKGTANLPGARHVDFFDMAPIWQNSGNTPATGITTIVGAAMREQEPTEDEFTTNLHVPKMRGVIAAKAEQASSSIRVTESFADDTVSTPRYLWGWIVYTDIFPKTKPHVTEFCIKATEIQHWQDGHLHFSGGVCERHNCVDQFCDDYSTIVAKAESQ